MIIDETMTYLEMTSPDQLVPARPAPRPMELRLLDVSHLALLRDTYTRVGSPHNWFERPLWSRQKWHDWLTVPGLRPWTVWVGEKIAGLVELRSERDGDIEIVVFGLVPEFVGQGYGGHALTLGVERAWRELDLDGHPARRLWLHTSTRDHPHALRNYQRRGFRPFRVREKQTDIPDGWRESIDATWLGERA